MDDRYEEGRFDDDEPFDDTEERLNEDDRLTKAQGLFQQAYEFQMAGKYEQAIRLYQQSIAVYPTAEAHTFLGWTYSFQGRLDDAIAAFVRRKYNLLIGDQTAEEIKMAIGSALPLDQELAMEVRGRDQVAGLPRTITVTSSEITEAIAEPLANIVNTVRSVLEKTPPELASDIIDRGMVMTGGGSLLRNIDRFLTKHTGVPCYVAENPVACVCLGAGRALEMRDILRRTLATS